MSWLIFRRRQITFSKTTLDLLLIFILMLIFYGQPLLNPTRMSLGGDGMNLFLPSLAHYREAVYHNSVPLWNSHTWLGAPFLATFQSMALYPPQAISLFFRADPVGTVNAQNFLVFLSLLWLAYGAYFFGLWALDLERYASMLMAVIMGCSGFVGGHMDHVNQLAAISWIPWIMGQALIILRHSKWSNMALMAFFVGMQVLAGHPQYVVYSVVYLGVLVACYSVYFYHRRRAEDPPGWHGIVMILCALVLGAGLASAQILPSAELSTFSVRPFDRPERMLIGSFPPTHIFASFIPGIYGSAAEGLHGAFDQAVEYTYPFDEFVCYVGIFPVLLALIAVFGLIRESIVRAFSILALFSIIVASGEYLVSGTIYRFIMMWFPGGDGFRVPARFMIFYTLSISVLAGVGLNYLSHYLQDRRRFRRLAIWPLCLFVLMVVFFDLNLFSFDQAFRYFGHSSVLKQHGPVLDFLNEEPQQVDSRIYRITVDPAFGEALHRYRHAHAENTQHLAASIRVHSLQPNLHRLWDKQTVRGYEEGLLPTMNFRTFVGADVHRGLIGRFHSNLSVREINDTGRATVDATFLGLLNVKYVISQVPLSHPNLKLVLRQSASDLPSRAEEIARREGIPAWRLNYFLYENLDFLPKVVWEKELESIISLKALNVSPIDLSIMVPDGADVPPDLRYRQMGRPEDLGQVPLPSLLPSGPDFSFYRPPGSPNEYLIEKNPEVSGRMLLLEAPYPGWVCRWEGGQTDMMRVNSAMMGGELPEGPEEVYFSYQPFSYRLGLFLSCCFAGLLCGILFYAEFPFKRLKHRRKASS